MKRRTTIVLAAGVLVIALAAVALAVGTQKSATVSATRCETYGQVLSNAKVEAINTTDGVTVKITGNTPESVELIQAFWQECGESHLLGQPCPCDSADCHAGGSCHQVRGSRGSDDCGSGCETTTRCGGCH